MKLASERGQSKNIFKKSLNAVVGLLGYQLVRKIPVERVQNYDSNFLELLKKRTYSEYTMLSLPNLYALYSAIKHAVENNIPGDIVECGVWRGGAMMLAADTLILLGDKSRNIWLYDTYTGMVEPAEVDVDSNGIHAINEMRQKKKTSNFTDWCYADITDVTANLSTTGYPKELLKFIKGDVLETIPKQSPEHIAILRLDTDWYESTNHEMRHLYPRLSSSGVLIVDDYGTWLGSKKAVDEYFAGKNTFLHRVDHTAVLHIK